MWLRVLVAGSDACMDACQRTVCTVSTHVPQVGAGGRGGFGVAGCQESTGACTSHGYSIKEDAGRSGVDQAVGVDVSMPMQWVLGQVAWRGTGGFE